MLARRFLGCIFFLTLIAVALGFAMFQFGGDILTRQMTPKGHYVAPPAATGPDYARADSWLARPDMASDPSRWLPDGAVAAPTASRAALFYIHPTTYLERDTWNAPLNPGGEAASRAALFVQSQASAFNAAADVWAPRYRQAAVGAFLLKSKDADQALSLAYRDVLAAFDAFLAAQPPGTPLILAGHSQGALHLSQLLVDRREALKGRLVAAYVVGWPLSATADLPAMGLSACSTKDETGCVLSWQSYKDPANPAMLMGAWVGSKGYAGGTRQRRDMVCVNPLTGSAGGAAPPSANPGTLVPDVNFANAILTAGQVGARCSDGLLLIDGAIPALGPYVLPGNNYHVYDYALFWGAIRADAARRLTAYEAAR
ncbi:MAG: DUF3089 domain-containing protein [Sphingomicrobium sp.]